MNNAFIRLLFTPIGQLWASLYPGRNSRQIYTERRDQLYKDIDTLRSKRADLINLARNAGKLDQQLFVSEIELLDIDLRQLNTQCRAVEMKMHISNTHRHNQAVIDIVDIPGTPTIEQLTAISTNAEERLESLTQTYTICDDVEVAVPVQENETRQAIWAEIKGEDLDNERILDKGQITTDKPMEEKIHIPAHFKRKENRRQKTQEEC